MIFYRVENDKNEGPYINDNYENLIDFFRNNDEFDIEQYVLERPTPYLENFEKYCDCKNKHKFIFGFSSKDRLVKWFSYSNENEYFEKYNFKVSYYESTEVFESQYQSISQRKNLTLIKRVNFKDFIDN